jgi:TRAP-type transport system small permease protein
VDGRDKPGHDDEMGMIRFLVDRVLAAVAAASLFLMMALTFVEVVARYFLGTPLSGAEEIKSFLLGITIFSALPLVTWQQRHIAVRSLAALLKGRALSVQRVVVLAGAVAGLSFISYLLADQTRAMAADGTLTAYLDLPEAPIVAVFAALAAFAAFLAATLLFGGGGAAGGHEAAGPE